MELGIITSLPLARKNIEILPRAVLLKELASLVKRQMTRVDSDQNPKGRPNRGRQTNEAGKRRGKTIVYTHIWTLFIFSILLTLFHPISLSFSHFPIFIYLAQYIMVAILPRNNKLDLIPEMQFYLRTCSDSYTLRRVCIVLYNL